MPLRQIFNGRKHLLAITPAKCCDTFMLVISMEIETQKCFPLRMQETEVLVLVDDARQNEI